MNIENTETALTQIYVVEIQLLSNQPIKSLNDLSIKLNLSGCVEDCFLTNEKTSKNENSSQNLFKFYDDQGNFENSEVYGDNLITGKLSKINGYELRYSTLAVLTLENVLQYANEILQTECKKILSTGQKIVKLEFQKENIDFSKVGNNRKLERLNSNRKSKTKFIVKQRPSFNNKSGLDLSTSPRYYQPIRQLSEQDEPHFPNTPKASSNKFFIGSNSDLDSQYQNQNNSNPQAVPEVPEGWEIGQSHGRQVFLNSEAKISTLSRDEMIRVSTKRHNQKQRRESSLAHGQMASMAQMANEPDEPNEHAKMQAIF